MSSDSPQQVSASTTEATNNASVVATPETPNTEENNESNNQEQNNTTNTSAPKAKRLQAQRACSNCKRLHARCDNERPCKRCSQNGLANTCVDLPRKRRMSRTYTEAVNKVWEARYNTQRMPQASPMPTMPMMPGTSWVPLPISSGMNMPKEPMLTSKPIPHHHQHPHQHPNPYDPQNLILTEIVNPNDEIRPQIREHYMPEVMQNGPSSYYEKQDPLMETFLYHQMTELRETNTHLERKIDYDNVRDRAFQQWHTFLPQRDFAISVWKSTNSPGLNFLVECNERFVELTGYPIEMLRNNFPCQKLFMSKGFNTAREFPKRTQIATAHGYKDVYLTIYSLFGDDMSSKYFILNMLEVRVPLTDPIETPLMTTSYAPEMRTDLVNDVINTRPETILTSLNPELMKTTSL